MHRRVHSSNREMDSTGTRRGAENERLAASAFQQRADHPGRARFADCGAGIEPRRRDDATAPLQFAGAFVRRSDPTLIDDADDEAGAERRWSEFQHAKSILEPQQSSWY